MIRPAPLRALRPFTRSLSTAPPPPEHPSSLSTHKPADIPPPDSSLNWDQYLSIRRRRHRWDLAASIPTTLAGFTLGGAYFAGLETEPGQLIFGLEAMWVYAGATLASGGLGWLVGPIIGSGLWRITHRRRLPQIEAKEREFYKHIQAKRVDPSRQSVQNPVPDYYGEKIGSLKDYRQWLRDQAVFRRKASWEEAER